MTQANTIHVRTQPSTQRSTAKSLAGPKHINDIIRGPARSLVVSPRPLPKRPVATSVKVSLKSDVTPPARQAIVGHVKAHKPQPAKTLMRTAVKRPSASLRRQVHAQTRTDVLIKAPTISVVPKHSIATVDSRRQQRAATAPQSKFVRRFAPDQASWFRQNVASASEPVAVTVTAKPLKSAAPTGHNRSMDVFQKALANATAHEQPAVPAKKHGRRSHREPRVHHRLTNIVAVSLAVVVLAGFFAYQNKAAITLRYASAKAGFTATLPASQPAGFAAGKFKYSAGQVAVQYAKPGTSRNYTLSQKRTTLNNQTILTASAIPTDGTYQTLQQGGSTIYIYGDGNAAWVNHGIFYQITSAGNLSTAEILSIATSV